MRDVFMKIQSKKVKLKPMLSNNKVFLKSQSKTVMLRPKSICNLNHDTC